MARRLGDILIDEKLITPVQRDEALRQQKLHGGRIGTNLVELGAIDLDALARALARQKGVPAALQKHFDSIHGEAVALVPAKMAEKLGAIPLGFTARSPRTIAVAFLDPAKPGAIDEIQATASSLVYPVVAPELRIVLYLEKLYWIPRPMRFLRLDLANAKVAGPSSNQAPLPSQGNSTEDPNSFFDMTRPDLSQQRPGSAILLTEAVPGKPPPANPSIVPPRVVEPPKAEATSDLNIPPATSSARPDSSRFGASPPAARQPPSMPPRGPAVPPRPASGPPITELASGFGAARATPAVFANSLTSPNAAPLVSAPPAVAPVPGSGTTGQPTGLPPRQSARGIPPPSLTPSEPRRDPPFPESHPSTPATVGPVPAPGSSSNAAPPSIATKPRSVPTPPPWRKPPEVLQRRADKTDASSRAPTIPDIPSFAIVDDEEQEPMQFRPEVVSGDAPNGAGSNATSAATVEPAPLPWSTVEAVDSIAVATNRDQVAQAIVNYLRSTCGVGLVLIVQHEVAMGWKGFAPGVGAAEIEGLAIPLAAPSALQIAHNQQSTFRGPPPKDGVAIDRQLVERLRSSSPQEVIVSPIIIRDRVVNLVYGHAENGGPLPDRLTVGLGTLTRAAAAAYVRLIQEAKKKQPS